MDIKDYLHLYLGVEYEFIQDVSYFIKKGTREFMTGTSLRNFDDYDMYGCFKLILRPLSDITDEERQEWLDFRLHDRFEFEMSLQICEANRTKYLLSKYFDLFGLIEAELAIDATKIKRIQSALVAQ